MPDPKAHPVASFAHPVLRQWFVEAFERPTPAQELAWVPIAAGHSTLLLAPTGSGKTLAAFLVALNRLVFDPSVGEETTRVIYVSPLKALGVDVERNLRVPLAGICAVAQRTGTPFKTPIVGVRTGDTSPSERARLIKHPPDILITTPESLFLMLTSRARNTLAHVDTIIIDEIHALVSGKRGAHLALSVERLEQLRAQRTLPLQRIGLSATQRSLDEIAQFLGGAERVSDETYKSRAVAVVDAGRTKSVSIRVEVPVDDMVGGLRNTAGQAHQVPVSEKQPEGEPSQRRVPSIWSAIYPRLVELVRSHRSTLLFVNSRRLAERLSAAINEEAGQELSLAHHGSISKERRAWIEDRLKRGELPALVATSSLELGIDMGAVDLVIQIEAPATVASAIQRIGRAGHAVGQVSNAVIFPKHRGDLLPCATIVQHVREGLVETSRFLRNPLDVLAQHVVSMLAMDIWTADVLFDFVRQTACFTQLPRSSFDGVLDMLSGRYPSERFRELRPRINWDRVSGRLEARRGAQLLVVSNGSVIVDRGLYGVFLAGSEPAVRVGELDEEMVFECRVGEVFVLGVSSWRIEDITHDRVLVSPAPGEPGRMPFWHGDKPGRPLELGRAVGALTRSLTNTKTDQALSLLQDKHGFGASAAANLVAYVEEQRETGYVPTDRRIVVESFLDEVGDWRVVVLSPFGGAVHAPWTIIVGERLRQELGMEVDSLWADDGMVFRLPELEQAPDVAWFIPTSQDAEERLTRALGGTALFAAHFRENAARSLLLPRRRPGQRMPLWVQRRRAADLLSLASEFPDFPIVLETYRECLQDKFDMRGLHSLVKAMEAGDIQVVPVSSNSASPFASTLLFSYVAQFIYGNDAPLAERRAQALTLDQEQLRQLLGSVEMRELFDADTIEEVEAELQRMAGTWEPRDKNDLLDLLRELGDLSDGDVDARIGARAMWSPWADALVASHQVVQVRVLGEVRWIALEEIGRYRDALGVAVPRGVPLQYQSPQPNGLSELILRFARTHGPFTLERVKARYQLSFEQASAVLLQLERQALLVQGAYLPLGSGIEYCHADVLRRLKRRSVAKLRQQVEPLDHTSYCRFMLQWHGVTSKQRGLDALLNVIEQLQGVSLPYGLWMNSVFPARIHGFDESDIDELCAAGEVVWRGRGSSLSAGSAGSGSGAKEARIEFYLTDSLPLLADDPEPVAGSVARSIRDCLRETSLFFPEIVSRVGGYPGEVFDTLWTMVWAGEVSNDTLRPVRSLLAGTSGKKRSRETTAGRSARSFRSRRQPHSALSRPGVEGRFNLLPVARDDAGATESSTYTQRATARARQLVRQWGVVTREAVAAGKHAGGFSATYPILKALDDTGELQRGYWVEGLGASQFVTPGVVGQLRTHRHRPRDVQWLTLAAGDPANVYGATVTWPTRVDEPSSTAARLTRAAGNHVVLERGRLVAWFSSGMRAIYLFISGTLQESQRCAQGLAEALTQHFDDSGGRACIIEQIDGVTTSLATAKSAAPDVLALQSVGGLHPCGSRTVRDLFVSALLDAGFEPSAAGLMRRRHSALLKQAALSSAGRGGRG